jgi:hypothetical protein
MHFLLVKTIIYNYIIRPVQFNGANNMTSEQNPNFKTIDEIRLNNMRMLISEAGGQNKFIDLVKKPQSQVSQLSGANPSKNIGNAIARHIEDSCDMPYGWMDNHHTSN